MPAPRYAPARAGLTLSRFRSSRAVATAAALAALALVCGPAQGSSGDRAVTVSAAGDAPGPVAAAGAPDSSVPVTVWTGPLPIRPSKIVMVVAGGAGTPSADSAPFGPPGASGALGIPLMVLRAYHLAADRVGIEQPSCKLPWWLLAGIGHTESGHAESGRLTADGTTRGRILGPRLNGGIAGDAVITDTDHGRYDGDTVYDRAVGPMQFIPATWVRWGADGNADGKRDPGNIFDATLAAAARYLCAGGRDLSTPAGLRSAVLSYNHSLPYLATVLAWGAAYRDGASALPDSSLPVIADVTRVRPPVSSRPPRRATGPIRLLVTNSTTPAGSSPAPSTSPASSASDSSCRTASPTATGSSGSSAASSSAASSSAASSSAASSSAASSSAASGSVASGSVAASSAARSASSSGSSSAASASTSTSTSTSTSASASATSSATSSAPASSCSP